MTSYKPSVESRYILERAAHYRDSVPYQVPARWIFYRLLQDSTLRDKKSYHSKFLPLLSKARKLFYDRWAPWSLSDDTRAAFVRGGGYKSEAEFIKALKGFPCVLDVYQTQPCYVECWFEAAAMEPQFRYYCHPAITLLAFRGDISIPEKWAGAQRLAHRWLELEKPIHVLYFGDYDPKGLQIPQSAWQDIGTWTWAIIKNATDGSTMWKAANAISFHRVGLNLEHISHFDIPENPERPGTYQWEALTDEQAASLINKAESYLNKDAIAHVDKQQYEIEERWQKFLDTYPGIE